MDFYSSFHDSAREIAVIDKSGQKFTYKQLEEKINEFSKNFIPGHKNLVLILGRNNLDTITTYLSCLKFDHALILLNQDITDSFFYNIIHEYKPDLLIIPREIEAPEEYRYVNSTPNYAITTRKIKRERPIYPNLNLILSTSGSTGYPKLVRLSKDHLNFNASSIVKFLSLNEKDRCITVLPFAFIFGLSIINTHLYSRSQILLTDETIFKRSFWDFFNEFLPTSLSGVPYIFETLLKMNFIHLEIGNLRLLTLSGGSLRREILDHWIEFAQNKNVDFYKMYGQTEAGGRISYLPPEVLSEKKESVGIPIPDAKIYIDTKEFRNGAGEIILTSPSVMLGYAEKEEDLYLGDVNQSKLITGDIGLMDQDGYLTIIGRKRNCIEVELQKICVDEVEYCLQSKGLECACLADQNKLKVAYTKETESKKIENELTASFQLNQNHYQMMKVNEIVRNANGKIQYSRIFW